jgi:hypothetical protein
MANTYTITPEQFDSLRAGSRRDLRFEVADLIISVFRDQHLIAEGTVHTSHIRLETDDSELNRLLLQLTQSNKDENTSKGLGRLPDDYGQQRTRIQPTGPRTPLIRQSSVWIMSGENLSHFTMTPNEFTQLMSNLGEGYSLEDEDTRTDTQSQWLAYSDGQTDSRIGVVRTQLNQFNSQAIRVNLYTDDRFVLEELSNMGIRPREREFSHESLSDEIRLSQ